MAKRPKRLNAKALARQTTLKKEVAFVVAECYMTYNLAHVPSTVQMLALGHKGFIGYHEKDLIREFEKYHDLINKEHDDWVIELNERLHKSGAYQNSHYFKQEFRNKALLDKLDDLANRLAENILLGDGKI